MQEKMREHVRKLRRNYRMTYSETLYHFREQVFSETLLQMRNQPRILALGTALRRYLEEKPVFLTGDDLLAGHGQFVDWTHSNPAALFEEINRLEAGENLTEHQRFILRQMRTGMQIGLYSRYPGGHLIPNYPQLLQTGLQAMIDKVRRYEAESRPGNRAFYGASLQTLLGAQKHILNYAGKAGALLKTCEETEARSRLSRIQESCLHIAYGPARSFFEALQLLWLAHEVTVSEQICGSLSFGRADQYLYPYFRRDMETGKLTQEEAGDLLQAFWLKCAGLPVGYQNLTLGGTDENGRDESNELTLLCLEATRLVQVDQPLVSLRVNTQMPEAVWEEALRVVETGIGFPALFNDAAIIPTRMAMGATKTEAYNYGVIGCVEQSIPGREYAHTEGMRHNWVKVLELMLNGGVCQITGRPFQLQTRRELCEIKSFDDFYKWFEEELLYTQDIALQYMQMADAQYGKIWPTPYASTLMDGCLESGRDVNEGGTVYNHSTINATGMSNAVDSLAAIREGVFGQQLVSLPELQETLRHNFSGAAVLRKQLRHLPKFGNGIKAVDILLTDLSNRLLDGLSGYINPRGGKYQMGFYSVGNHAILGQKTGATPDGRYARTAVANSLAPVQGADVNGPTAVLLSVLHAPMERLHNGMALDLKFSPHFFNDAQHKAAVKTLVTAFFKEGGQEIQFNVVDRETLLDAQKHPDLHRDLLVRVSGFSAFFVTLDLTLQNEIIARSEYSAL